MALPIPALVSAVISVAPELAKYIPKILATGSKGVDYLKNVLEINNLNQANKKENKKIEECYQKIGKFVYENNIAIDDIDIKEDFDKVKSYIEKIEINKKHISEIETKNKESKILDDVVNICSDVDIEDDEKTSLLDNISSLIVNSTKKKKKKK